MYIYIIYTNIYICVCVLFMYVSYWPTFVSGLTVGQVSYSESISLVTSLLWLWTRCQAHRCSWRLPWSLQTAARNDMAPPGKINGKLWEKTMKYGNIWQTMGKTMKHGKTIDGNNFERTMNNYGKPIGEKYEKTMGKLWENYGTYGPMLPAVRDPSSPIFAINGCLLHMKMWILVALPTWTLIQFTFTYHWSSWFFADFQQPCAGFPSCESHGWSPQIIHFSPWLFSIQYKV